ncbi:iron-containing alcohol dehydrogenase [Pseudoroseomonas wenyumeiae]|uniref:Alcohol dehydrogenase 2 n=1 Tax=Teichococcus wenyumeiae TaxID=2478470 RepID=A0A3A9JM23_9PROT|nr:iron-containing alcohol dehydrogenase [Pseudoroseomonas wenyumeiae]RKK05823.1 iron-containing alcohol dehydrogenase [Pseudoroseomonas wenyumeiae]RMI25657.1 iron-containing alcohol dehydrogenase [Pseudoroseomonas wenyumeiae]
MTPISLVAPRKLLIGGGALAKLPALLAEFGLSRPLVVTDPWMVSSGTVERALAPLKGAGIATSVFSETVPDPTDTVVQAGVEALRAGDFDCLIGFGGGSPMDTAKAIAILAAAAPGQSMRDFKVPASADRAALPVICVPTTAGTGSEATRFTIVTDTQHDEKMLIAGLGALPLAAVVDYELTFSVPARVTADTGIDSLTHALEAYVSARANSVSDIYAQAAMRLIASNLRTAYAEPQNRAARAAMMEGATLAGLAFSNSSVALVHGMSRPLGAHFHVPHGLSNAMLLPAITAFGLEAGLPRYAEAARVMDVAPAGTPDAEAGAMLLDELRALNEELGVPTPRAYGIPQDRFDSLLELMAEQALASGSPGNNPRVPSTAEIIALYREVYGN